MNDNGRTRPAGPGTWTAAALYCALTLVLTYPISVQPHRVLLDDSPDPHLFMWTLAWDAHAFVHEPLSIFDANIFYPNPNTLAYSENLIGSALFVAPVLWVTNNPVLAVNLVSLLSCVLCGLGAYLLGRRLGMSKWAAFLCGLIFAFAPPRFGRFNQIHLSVMQWIPFSLAYLHAYLDHGRARDLGWALVFFVLQALSSGHGVVFLTVAVAMLLGYRALAGEPMLSPRRLVAVAIPGALAGIVLVLLFLPYRTAQASVGLKRTLDAWDTTIESFVASPTPVHRAVMSLFTTTDPAATATAFLFPGYVPLLLTLALIVWRKGNAAGSLPQPAARGLWRWAAVRRRDPVPVYATAALVSVGISLGPPVSLWPLIYWWPVFNFIRVPSRFTLLGILALAVLAGLGFDRLRARLSPRAGHVAAAVLALLLVVEFGSLSVPSVPYRVELPAADVWLASRTKPFVVAEIPTTPYDRSQTTFMLHSMAHWQKTIHGYSGIKPISHERLFAEVMSFPDDRSVEHLTRLGVTYVIVHLNLIPPERRAGFEADLERFSARLALAYSDADSRVYALRFALPPESPRR